MTTKGRILLVIIVLAVAGFSIYRWADKIAPAANSNQTQVQSPEPAAPAAAGAPAPAKPSVDAKIADIAAITSKLLAGDKKVALVGASNIPAVQGVSAYKLDQFQGKPLIVMPINVWPGWAPIIVANNGLEPNDNSIFAKQFGFYVKLTIVDDPVKSRDLYASGQTVSMWATLDMVAIFAPELVKDSRTVPVGLIRKVWS